MSISSPFITQAKLWVTVAKNLWHTKCSAMQTVRFRNNTTTKYKAHRLSQIMLTYYSNLMYNWIDTTFICIWIQSNVLTIWMVHVIENLIHRINQLQRESANVSSFQMRIKALNEKLLQKKYSVWHYSSLLCSWYVMMWFAHYIK